MSENLPYEDQINRQFEEDNDLPLPDMDQSWQKMKKLMREDKKKRFLPPPFLNGCTFSLLLIGLLVLIYLKLRPSERYSAKEPVQKQSERSIAVEPGRKKPLASTESHNHNSRNTRENKQSRTVIKQRLLSKINDKKIVDGQSAAKEKQVAAATNRFSRTRAMRQKGITRHLTEKPPIAGKIIYSHKIVKVNDNHKDGKRSELSEKNGQEEIISKSREIPAATTTNSGVVKIAEKQNLKDSLPSAGNEVKSPLKSDKQSKEFYFGAGVALQQQIPLKGQKAVPYNFYGRTGSLADYIPSVYSRLYRTGKWFLQAEFRYGAPQNTKQINYSQKKLDSMGAGLTRRSLQLKKTYYHQVPITFNYFVLPNLSIGAGIMYSRFYGAVSEEQLTSTNLLTSRDSILRKSVIKVPANTDSFFTRSQLHAVLEAQYQWRRLSAGFRYTAGLQPYIKYNISSGEQKREKNQSLQVFLRYELWQSSKNKKK